MQITETDKWYVCKLVLLLCGIFLLARHARAEHCEDYLAVNFGGWSHHFISNTKTDNKWNEDHSIFGVQCNRWSAHKFVNSYDRDAYSVGYTFPLRNYERYTLGIYAGVWSGYRDVIGDLNIMPVATPVLTYRVGRLDINFMINPVVGVVHFGWRL